MNMSGVANEHLLRSANLSAIRDCRLQHCGQLNWSYAPERLDFVV
jgi:hypothetical protein